MGKVAKQWRSTHNTDRWKNPSEVLQTDRGKVALRVYGHTSMEANRMGTEFLKRVRERAYQLWEAEGCQHGHDMEHWLRAAAQITAEQETETGQISIQSLPNAPRAETAQKPSGKAAPNAPKDHMETKAMASPVPRKTRSKKFAASSS